MTNNEEQINQYEDDIFEQLKNLPKLKKKGLDEIIIKKIKEQDPDKYKSFYSEKWQLHYAKERIKTEIEKYNKQNTNEEKMLQKSNKKGFGGWLIFFIIGIISQPFLLIYQIFNVSGFFLYHIQLIFSFLIIYLLLKKKKIFIKYVVAYIISSGIINILANFYSFKEAAILNSRDFSNALVYLFLQNILVIIIWVLYFTKSQRVKNTFIN